MSKQGGRKLEGRRRELLEILPGLRRFALCLAGNPADGDDLLQSTVERILERGLPDGAELMPWSVRVCRNLWIDEVRARKVRRSAAEDPALARDQVVSGDADMTAKLTLHEVGAALAALPEEQRVVLELVAVEGFAYREAAAALEIPIGTVMSRLARARAQLIERSGKLKPTAQAQEDTRSD